MIISEKGTYHSSVYVLHGAPCPTQTGTGAHSLNEHIVEEAHFQVNEQSLALIELEIERHSHSVSETVPGEPSTIIHQAGGDEYGLVSAQKRGLLPFELTDY